MVKLGVEQALPDTFCKGCALRVSGSARCSPSRSEGLAHLHIASSYSVIDLGGLVTDLFQDPTGRGSR